MATRTNPLTGNRRYRLESATTIMVRENRKQAKAFERAVARYNKQQEGFVGNLFEDNFIAQERRNVYDY